MNKNMQIVAALMAVGLVSPMAYATNGTQMFAIGAESTALGGTGVAHFMGAENTFANPAMLGKSKGSEVVGGFVYFKPVVTNTGMPTTQTQMGARTGNAATSSRAPDVIPDVSYSSRISDSLTYGVAMAGIAGMGVDYSGAAATNTTQIAGKTAMMILHVIPTIAYNTKEYGVGFSPILQAGSLMVSYNTPGPSLAVNATEKAASSTGFGYSLGGYYDVTPILTVAAAYKSAIEMTYGTQLSGAGNGFGLCGTTQPCMGAPFGDKLAQPAEMKAGVAYTMANVTLTADYKTIKWGSATGYKDFNWKDQKIVAVGAKYAGNGYWVGVGYNAANNPIGEKAPAGNMFGTSGTEYRNAAVNFFNNLMFPAIVENTMTFGGGYALSKTLSLEGALAVSPEVKTTVDTTAVVQGGVFAQAFAGAVAGGMSQANAMTFAGGQAAGVPRQTNTTTHSQSSISLSLRYKF